MSNENVSFLHRWRYFTKKHQQNKKQKLFLQKKIKKCSFNSSNWSSGSDFTKQFTFRSFSVVFSLKWQHLLLDLSQLNYWRTNAWVHIFIRKHNGYNEQNFNNIFGPKWQVQILPPQPVFIRLSGQSAWKPFFIFGKS